MIYENLEEWWEVKGWTDFLHSKLLVPWGGDTLAAACFSWVFFSSALGTLKNIECVSKEQ